MALLDRIQIDERVAAPTAEQTNRIQTNIERALKRVLDQLTTLIIQSSSAPGGGASTADAFVTVGHPADLTAERALTGSPSILVLDGGANGPVTLSVVTAGLGLTEADIAGLVADLAAKVPITRVISTTSPLAGGGALSADLTLSLGAIPESLVTGLEGDLTTGERDFVDLQRHFRLLLKRYVLWFKDIPPGLEEESQIALATD